MTGKSHTKPSAFMSLLDEQPSTVERSRIKIIPDFNPRLPLAGELDPFSESALADLIHSIKQQGILQPLLLRAKQDGDYELIAGERRFHAAGYAGMREVPVYIRDLDDVQARLAALTENGQRAAIPYAQEARAGLNDIARRAGISIYDVPALLNRLKNGADDEFGIAHYLQSVFGETVSNWAQRRALVLKLLPDEFNALNERKVNLTALQHLIRLGNREERAVLLAQLLDGSITTEQLVTSVDSLLKSNRVSPRSEKIQRLRQSLSKLGKLAGPQGERADELIEELLKLTH